MKITGQRAGEWVAYLLETREGQFFECKRARTRPRDALESVVALANADGGCFALGLEDPRKAEGKHRLVGISENRENAAELVDQVSKEITPPARGITPLEIEITNLEAKPDELIVFLIPKSPLVHSLRRGDTYIRRGTANRKLTAEEITRLKYAKGETKYEDEPVEVALDELDNDLIERYRVATRSRAESPWEFLRKNGLAIRKNGEHGLTKACVLLFGKNPSVSLRSKCGIKISIYQGAEPYYGEKSNLATKPRTVEGPLIRQINRSYNYLKSWLEKGPPALVGAGFRSRYRYPTYALQEAITNAVLHRDYSIQNDIQIRMFDNRMEFISPGNLPGHITPHNITKERFARNPVLVRTLNRFPNSPNLDIGEGVKRIFQSMKSARLADPIYTSPSNEHLVRLILPHDERAPYWERVKKHLEKEGRITNQVLKEITGIQDTLRVSRLLQKWVNQGLLEPRGAKRNRYYTKSGMLEVDDLIAQIERLKRPK